VFNLGKIMKKIVCLFVCLFVGSANAASIFFNDRASFDAATTSSILNFESFENNFTTAASITLTDFTVSETGGTNVLGQARNFSGLLDASITDGTGAILFDDNGSSIGSFFSFTDSVNAFGLDIATDVSSTMIIGGSVSDTINLAANTASFWGVIDMGGITSITFDASGTPIVGFDAVSFGQVNASVPEPTSLALLSLGLAGFGFSRKNKTA